MGLILQLPVDVADMLLADPYFEDVPVLSLKRKERLSELQNRINNISLGGATLLKRLRSSKPNVPGPYYDEILMTVGIIENRTVNSTGKAAEDVIEKVAQLLHGKTPQSLSSEMAVYDVMEMPPKDASDKEKVLWVAFLRAEGGTAVTLPKIETPVIMNEAGLISLACDTPGAAIFWRADGKHPNPRVGAGSTLYAGQFAADAGAKIRVRAWLAGYLASEVASLNL